MIIDAVYTWVDGQDVAWQEQRRARREQLALHDDTTEIGFADRYVQHGELQWSLKILQRHAPWLRRVFIITMNQVPPDIPENVTIVDHTVILPADVLPTFNSHAIETVLHKIPDLSEHFIYFNDDMFVGAPVTTNDFFDGRGRPVLPWAKNRELNHLKRTLNNYEASLYTSALLVAQHYGLATAAYCCRYPSHTAVPKTKTSYERAWQLLPQEMRYTQQQPFRGPGQLIHYVTNYIDLAAGEANMVIGEAAYFATELQLYEHWQRTHTLPRLFCVNQIRGTRFAELMKMVTEERTPVVKIRRRKF